MPTPPEGYTQLFGNVYLKNSAMRVVEDIIPDMPDFNFTDLSCQSVLGMYKDLMKTIEDALAMPRKILRIAKKLLDYPFEKAAELLSVVNNALSEMAAAVDALLSGGALLDDAKKLLEQMLACPLLADSPAGQAAAGILDAIDSGLSIPSQLVEQLKQAMNKTVNEALDSLKKTPLEALNNIEKMYQDLLQKSGINELLKQLEAIEKCLEAACTAIQIAENVPQHLEDLVNGLGGRWDKFTGTLQATAVKTNTAAQQVIEDFVNLTTYVKVGP